MPDSSLSTSAATDVPQGGVRILDDNGEVLHYLSCVLASQNISCAPCRNVEELFSDCGSPPTCVLVDWHLGTDDGLEVAARCRDKWPQTAVILISGYATVPIAVSAMRQGLDGVLQKPIAPQELLAEISAAIVRSQARNANAEEQADARRRVQALKKQEVEILKLLASGTPNKNIAVRLSLAVRTVEKYRRSLFDNLGVDSAAEATRILVLANLDH
jgi:two-component system, LuxR family, response regulator DctR